MFVGSGEIHGIMKVKRDDVVGGVETKIIIFVTEKEFEEIKETYRLVINEIRKVSEEEIINLLPTFLDKKKSI